MGRRALLVGTVLCVMASGWAWAQDETAGTGEKAGDTTATPAPAEAPPLPCQTIEGNGGLFITPMAYLVNPSSGSDWLGKPALAFTYAGIGDKDFESISALVTVWKRLELSVAHERLGLGDWPDDVSTATGKRANRNSVRLETANARLMIIEEKGWLPAVTAGVTYKWNQDVWAISDSLGGVAKAIGVRHHDDLEYTLTASKTFTNILPRPFILTAGLRNTSAVQTGLFGFTDDRDTVIEASAVIFLTDRLLLSGEWRQKPDNLKRVPGLVGKEDDWYAICLGYVVNDHMTVAGGWGHFGNVLNKQENGVWGIHIKYEF